MHCARFRAFSSADFPALSLVLAAKEPHSHELTHVAGRSPLMEALCSIEISEDSQMLKQEVSMENCWHCVTFQY